MKNENGVMKALPVLFGFFVMGFCDIVGISSDYVQEAFGWSNTMTGFVPSMVFIWFLFLGIPVGVKMNKWGRKNTVLLSMVVTVVGMIIPLAYYSSVTCMVAFALLGIGNAILQVSLNPLLNNVITNKKLLTSSDWRTSSESCFFFSRPFNCCLLCSILWCREMVLFLPDTRYDYNHLCIMAPLYSHPT